MDETAVNSLILRSATGTGPAGAMTERELAFARSKTNAAIAAARSGASSVSFVMDNGLVLTLSELKLNERADDYPSRTVPDL